MVAPSQEEARLLFSTAMAAAARIVGNRPGPLDPPSQAPQAWRAYAPGREEAVEAAMKNTGVTITDPKNGLSFRRIDAKAAVDSVR